MTIRALKTYYDQLPERTKDGLAAGFYSVVAVGAAASMYSAFSSKYCQAFINNKIAIPYCRGGVESTAYYAGGLPAVCIYSAMKAKECFLNAIR